MAGEQRGVVVTGMGLVTPLGIGVERNWEGLTKMETGLAQYPAEGVPRFLQYMGRVRDFEVDKNIPHKLLGQMKFLNRGSLLGFSAASEALAQAGFDLSVIPPERRALYVASGDMTKVGYDFMYPATNEGTRGRWQEMDFEKLNQGALNKVNPFFLLESILNNLFSVLSAFLEFMGPNTSLASHSPCGGNALELSCRSIMQGYTDIAMAVGCGNWITEIPLYEMEGLGILSQCREGVRSYRPFDKKRDGFIPGEGGAALFLEASDMALRRNAPILARIRGVGNSIEFSTDATLSVPPVVTVRSMREALDDAGCDLTDLAFISPHGSGSQKGDDSELRSVAELCGTKRQETPICGLKAYTGHLAATSDLAEVIFGIKALRDGMVPGTLHFVEADREFGELSISGSHRQSSKRYFLSTSYGIGGQSSSVIVQAL